MPNAISVRPTSLLAAVQQVRCSRDATDHTRASLAQIGLSAQALLTPLRVAGALSSFALAWQPVLVELVVRADALAACLAQAGGDYARIDSGLATVAGSRAAPAFSP